MNKPRNPQTGISLLETLIALAIMAMIAIIIASSIDATGRVLNRTLGVGAEIDLALSRLVLRQFVEAAVLVPFPDSPVDQPIFVGRTNSFTFQAVVDDGQFWPGNPVTVTVSVKDDRVVNLRAVGTSVDEISLKTSDTALTGVGGNVLVEYFGRKKAEELQRWHSSWDIGTIAPDAIKITLSESKRTYPPLVLRPAKSQLQSEMSLSSLLPPILPSRP